MSASVFASAEQPTMRFALDLLAEQKNIAPRKIRSWTQDALRACELFEVAPHKLVAHAANLRPRFRRVALSGVVRAKRLSNIKHSVKCILKILPSNNQRSFKAALNAACAELEAMIPDRYHRVTMRPILQYCSAQGLLPSQFDAAHNLKLQAALVAERLNGDPIITHQNAVRCSNHLKLTIPGWPIEFLTSVRRQEIIIRPWVHFPVWVEAACRAFVERSTTCDPFDLSRPMKKWRPRTCKTYLRLLRGFFSMLDRADFDLRNAGKLRDVATLEVAEIGLRWMLAQSKQKRGYVTAAMTARLLSQIARNPDMKGKLDEAEKAANDAVARNLSELAGRLHSERGLSGKTRDRLAPLKDEANLSKLFLVPFGIEREIAKSKKSDRRLALLAQWAVALMILTFCPLRISTLRALEDRHFVWSLPNQRGELSLKIEAELLKNNEQQDIPLPKECARLIRLYLRDYRHLLVKGSTTFLFPGATASQAKLPGVLSTQLSRLIRKRTTFEVNPHLYRHIVHLVVLKRFPGAYVMISRVLTHKSLQTAVTNYAYFDVELSMKAFHQLVREVQTGTSTQKSASLSNIAYNDSEYKHGSR